MAILVRNILLSFILGWVTYTDLKRKEIDHTPLIIGTLFIIPFTILGYNDITIKESLIGGLICFVVVFIFCLFGMGGGDLKLMTMLGLALGWQKAFLGFYLGTALSFVIFVPMLIAKKTTMKTSTPLAPFITVGTICTMLFYKQIISTVFMVPIG